MLNNCFYLFAICLLTSCVSLDRAVDTGNESLAEYRKTHLKDLLEYKTAPLKKRNLRHVSFYDQKSQYQVSADFEIYAKLDTIIMGTYSGQEKAYIPYGKARFSLHGEALSLVLFQSVRLMQMEEYSNHLFLPFKDITNGETTYGGGRYLDLDATDIDKGQVLIDFNKAYNPWCAYSDGFNCPIPPFDNLLPVPVRAGEKNYTGPKNKR